MKLNRLLRFRWVILFTYISLLAFSIAGSSNLGINPNNRVFFSPGDRQYLELLAFESEFGTNTSLLIGITSSESIFEDEELISAVRWVTDRIWVVEGVARVDSLATYPYGEYAEDEIRLTTLADAFCPNVCDSREAAELMPPHIVNRFVSEDGRTLAVIASVELDEKDSVAVSRINSQANQVMREFVKAFPSLEVNVTGGVPMMQAFMDASNHDLNSLVLVAIVLFIILLWIFFRGIYLTTILVALGVSSILITLGIAGWFGHTVNTATATTPLVIFTLVVAGSMHVFLYVAREPCASREEVRLAIERAYAANTNPVMLAAATSVIGLLSLVFVSAPPIKQLGVLSALGVVVGTTLLLVVAPCALALIKRVRPSIVLTVVQRWLNDHARRIEVKSDRPVPFCLMFLVCVALLPLMVVDEDFVRYFGVDNQFRVDSEAVTERLAGPYHAEIVIDTDRPGGIYQADVIESVESLEAHIRSDDAVVNVLSVADVLREVAKSLTNSSSLEKLGSDSLAQFFLAFELALAKGQSTTDFVDVDHRMVRISVLLGDVSMAEIRSFEQRVHAWANDELPVEFRLAVTGEGIPTAHLSSNSIRQLAIGIVLCLVISSSLLGIIYKSMKVVGVVLLAITIPVLAGFGLWAVAVGEIGMAATLVVAVTIGVVIDDSIHLLYRFRDGTTGLDLSPTEAAGYSVHRTAAAILTTSFVLAGGFSVLMLSDFRMNSAFGVCSALVIVLALVYNITLMPRALTWVGK